MSEETPTCVASCKDGSPCNAYPIQGSDKCRMHAGTSSDGESHENNGFSETHGLTASADKWFKRHREDVEDDVKQMVDDWMELAPFGWDVSGNVRMLTNAAINECQIEGGDEYIEENGAIVKEEMPAGESVIQKDVENPAFLYKSRLQKDTLRILNKFGILDSPESQQADAQGDIAEAWREALSE